MRKGNRHETHSFIIVQGSAAVLHSPLMRLLPKVIPILLEKILYAAFNAKHLQSMRPMAFIQRTEAKPILRKDKRFDILHYMAYDYHSLSCVKHRFNHATIYFIVPSIVYN